jgi:bifunctional N-acetylglucosamine-1-phosphate-uridyltransferase/glucosamine-1-phosphate-acetyltransferase GlmU-like protein
MNNMNNLAITIMAAGEGKRMNSSLPKVLHLFKGIPMLIRIILEVINWESFGSPFLFGNQ